MNAPLDHIDLCAPFGAAGTVCLPGSKSISNRVLLLAALALGRTKILNLLESDDTRFMLDALAKLGVDIEHDRGSGVCLVNGLDGRIPVKDAELFLGNAGTAFRPLTAVLALAGGDYRLSGVPRMHERPINDLVDALRSVGADVRYCGSDGFPPLGIHRGNISVRGAIRVRGDVSSQFLTALLIALPLIGKSTEIEVDGDLVSRPYIEITLNLMERFGVRVEREGWARFRISGQARYQSPGEIAVEGDASGASYFLAAGALGGGPVRVEGVGMDSIQGDVKFADALSRLGARVSAGEGWIEARSAPNGFLLHTPLKSFDLDLNHIPDAAMTLAVLALFCDGTCRLRNIANWRVKETDRLSAMATELRKLGAVVDEGQDFLEISPPARLNECVSIDTYDDHRIAMCFALVALSGIPVRINDPGCVAKTFPDFFDRFAQLVDAPVIAIDGPSGSGKGTVAQRVAQQLGMHYLDSGALYRVVALQAQRKQISLENEQEISMLARTLALEFRGDDVFLEDEQVTDAIRTEAISDAASRVAKFSEVRQALMDRQRVFRRAPGLVADGRDMASVVFPDAALKIYLTATPEARAQRRYKQLIDKGLDANLASLLRDIKLRDARDSNRGVAPLQKCVDAQVLDTTNLTVVASVDKVVGWFREA